MCHKFAPLSDRFQNRGLANSLVLQRV